MTTFLGKQELLEQLKEVIEKNVFIKIEDKLKDKPDLLVPSLNQSASLDGRSES